jgi:hypothetical protein
MPEFPFTRRKLKAVIGRAERVDFPSAGVFNVPAKIDTGAYRTSVWATDIKEKDGLLTFKLMGPGSEFYSGQECSTKNYELVDVENSFGQKEKRYSIQLQVKVGHKKIRTNITLADRSKKTYPVLIGRKFLRGRYLVDVSEGEPIEDEETLGL